MDTVPEVVERLRPDLDQFVAEAGSLNAPTHVLDQLDAAVREATGRVREVGANAVFDGATPRHGKPGAESYTLALLVTIVGLGQRGCKPVCEHIHPSLILTPRPVLVCLTAKTISCYPCAEGLLDGDQFVVDVEDGLCDYCQRPTDEFVPILTNVGPLTVTGQICETCSDGWVALTDA